MDQVSMACLTAESEPLDPGYHTTSYGGDNLNVYIFTVLTKNRNISALPVIVGKYVKSHGEDICTANDRL